MGRGKSVVGGGVNKFKCVHMNTVLGLLGNMFVKKHKEPLCTPPQSPEKLGGGVGMIFIFKNFGAWGVPKLKGSLKFMN